ncbi:MAG: hypothetical protein A4E52_01354 [Pelotomaculum sp. PtaB.Bin013]|nr:MAG: hypothetical protein A4E52_01354 [Pelotomaculum sp. PtaB.Bin013]
MPATTRFMMERSARLELFEPPQSRNSTILSVPWASSRCHGGRGYGLIYLITPPAFFSDEKLVEHFLNAYNSFPKEKRKPLLSVFTFGSHVAELRRLFERGGIPTLEFPDVAASVMANMVWHGEWRKSRLNYGL